MSKKKPVDSPVTRQRKLAEDWAKLMASHSKPLERGAQARGIKVSLMPALIASPPTPYRRETERIPSLPMFGTATAPTVDPLASAKHDLKGRVGVAYNKGGLQFLTDGDLAEQKTGNHRRRT